MALIAEIGDSLSEAALDLLCRFFHEEGFAGDKESIRANFDILRKDAHHWAAGSVVDGQMVGIVTVTTMLYVEWGRLGEVGDLYVLPNFRGKGIARALLQSAIDWCRLRGCSAVAVTVTREGEARYRLSQFYAKSGFRQTGRISLVLRFDERGDGPGSDGHRALSR